MEKLTLKAARVNANLTQKQLGDLMNVHENTIASWENDPKKLSIENAEKLCHILKVPFRNIFFG